MNLVKQIKELQGLIVIEETDSKRKINKMKDDLETLRRLNDACEKCEGTGYRTVREFDKKVSEFAQIIGYHTKQVPCNNCGGTGIIHKEKDDE